MNWIKQNSFLSALAGGTLLVCAILAFMASKSASKYEQAKSDFDDAYSAVLKSEKLPLYPKANTRDAKKKALDDYRESINQLRALYDRYRVEKVEDISTQQFTERLKAASSEVEKAFEASSSELPENFFMGFDSYRGQYAKTSATGLLGYQLNGLKHALLELAEARPTRLMGVYREKIPEEDGQPFELPENEVAREFSFEIVFKGSEASVRKFISSLGDIEPYYYVIRSIRINNERESPPKVSDAEFEKTPAAAAAVQPVNPFGAGFFEEVEAQPDAVQPDAVQPDPAVADEEPGPVAPPIQVAPIDTTKILSQVLGDEELIVFVRFDLMMFLPSKELP